MCRGITPIDAALGALGAPGAPSTECKHGHTHEHAFSSVVAPKIPEGMRRSPRWTMRRFDLQDRIYDGVASCVWTAVDRPSGITVVLKCYRKETLSELGMCQVEREVNLHMGLSHANIVQLYAAFEDEENVVLVLEHADGCDLFRAVKGSPGATFDERTTADEIVAPCLAALDYMHDLGIVHRDIKPENVFIDADGRVKMGDFGLAIDAAEERPVTRLGTLDYMAPEVLVCPDKTSPRENKHRSDVAYTSKVDVWAIGVMTYELLVGAAPFDRSTRPATYDHILGGEPEFPATMSKAARSFVKAALCKSPAKRACVKELLDHPWLGNCKCNSKAETDRGGASWVPAPSFKLLQMQRRLLDPFVAALTPDVVCQLSPTPPPSPACRVRQAFRPAREAATTCSGPRASTGSQSTRPSSRGCGCAATRGQSVTPRCCAPR